MKTLKNIIIFFLNYKIIIISIGILGIILLNKGHFFAQVSENWFLNSWAQFDGNSYINIAKNGYSGHEYVFFPLFPFLIKILAIFIKDYILSGFIIANFCNFLSLYILYKLIKLDFDNKIAANTILALVLFPTAFFFTSIYTESLFLFLALSTFYFARKNDWLTSGIFGFFASLTRLAGLFLIIPLIFEYIAQKEFKFKKIDWKIWCLLLIPLGFLVFLGLSYYNSGDFLIFFNAEKEWAGREITFPGQSISSAVFAILTSGPIMQAYNLYNLGILLLFLMLSILAFFKLRKSYAIYAIISLLIPVSSATLEAISRYVLVIFPCFMLMGVIYEENKKIRGILLASLIFSFLLSILFIMRHVNGGFTNF